MAPQPAPSPKVCFGPFEFDPAASELKKFDARVRLQGQPILILTMLLYQPGEIVTREEIRRYLWSGIGKAEAEIGLDLAMEKLRHALGDKESDPQYIETLPGGYRFIGPVHKLRQELPIIEVESVAAPITPRPATPRWRYAAAAAAAVALAGLVWWMRQPARLGDATQRIVTAPQGFALETMAERQNFALSADGAQLAFTALDAKGTAHVFLQDLTRPQPPRELPGTIGAQTLFWAPDGRALFVAVKGKLERVDPASNSFNILSDVPASVLSGTWLSTDRLLLSGWNTSLSLTQTEGAPRDLGARFHWPQALPDGEHFLYSMFDASAGRHQVRAALIDGVAGDGWDLTHADSRAIFAPSQTPGASHLLFVRDGNLFAQPFDPQAMRVTSEPFLVARHISSSRATGAADFTVSANGVLAYQKHLQRSQLVWVDRTGREISAASPANLTVKSGRLSPDGSRIVAALYDIQRGEQDFHLLEGTNTPRRLSAARATRDDAVWSRDGQSLAYSRGSAPRAPQTFIRSLKEDNESNADPASGDRLTSELPGDWSPDGRFLLTVTTNFPRFAADQQSDIAVIDLTRNRRRRPLIESRFDETLPAFSPDGRWLAFVSNESGEPEVYAQEFEGGDEPAMLHFRQLVTRGGAQALRWRRDGQELFYLGLDGRVYAVPVKWGNKPSFGQATALFSISAEARATGPGRLSFDVSPDGERFLIAKVTAGAKPSLVVVRNWESLRPR